MAQAIYSNIQDEIRALKAEKDAVILAHNYQELEVQKVADHLGDSLYLARMATQLKHKVILFAGVHFMAETVSMLAPDKTVLLPDLGAGCSLANTIRPEDIRRWRQEHPKGLVVSYVNTSATVKAESDYCCTSSNSIAVVESLPKDREIFFVPDFFLGLYTQRKTGRKLHLWRGFCHVHERITSKAITQAKKEHSHADLLMHPECGCLTKSMHLADKILSTGGMINYVDQSQSNEFLIATETGLRDQLADRYPKKKFYSVGDNATCEYMKLNTLEKIVESLERMQHRIVVAEPIAEKAKKSIERMLAII